MTNETLKVAIFEIMQAMSEKTGKALTELMSTFQADQKFAEFVVSEAQALVAGVKSSI